MAKSAPPKRMSDIFASSSEKDAAADTSMTTATPPYSSEGPTLPIIGAPEDTVQVPVKDTEKVASNKRKRQDRDRNTVATKQSHPQSRTLHPSLYTPWVLLPTTLRKSVKQENIVPVVFSKNQNVKSGINRLKCYLSYSHSEVSTIQRPDALDTEEGVIAISAQGDGSIKMVGIVELVRRIVSKGVQKGDEKKTEWWMYNMLSSVEVSKQPNRRGNETGDKESEAMEVDGAEDAMNSEGIETKHVPVLTVWITRRKIPAFKTAFGEHLLNVRKLDQEED
ncbi:hypothetical protein ACN47E_003564 [Coniothyrium glycines]